MCRFKTTSQEIPIKGIQKLPKNQKTSAINLSRKRDIILDTVLNLSQLLEGNPKCRRTGNWDLENLSCPITQFDRWQIICRTQRRKNQDSVKMNRIGSSDSAEQPEETEGNKTFENFFRFYHPVSTPEFPVHNANWLCTIQCSSALCWLRFLPILNIHPSCSLLYMQRIQTFSLALPTQTVYDTHSTMLVSICVFFYQEQQEEDERTLKRKA